MAEDSFSRLHLRRAAAKQFGFVAVETIMGRGSRFVLPAKKSDAWH